MVNLLHVCQDRTKARDRVHADSHPPGRGQKTAVSLNSEAMTLTVLASAGQALAQAGQPAGEELLAFVLR
jgi:hypothetical protein